MRKKRAIELKKRRAIDLKKERAIGLNEKRAIDLNEKRAASQLLSVDSEVSFFHSQIDINVDVKFFVIYQHLVKNFKVLTLTITTSEKRSKKNATNVEELMMTKLAEFSKKLKTKSFEQ